MADETNSGHTSVGATSMVWWQAALWATLGAALVEANDLYQEIRKHRKVPWKGRRTRLSWQTYLLGTLLRLFISAGVGLAAGASGIAIAPWIAMGIGIGASAALERIADNAYLSLNDRADHLKADERPKGRQESSE